MKSITNFFIFCSGSNEEILTERTPLEIQKYTGIGATVFFTGLLASISFYYCLYTIFDAVIPSILLSIVWGAMIFNIDRLVVGSSDKTWRAILPRVILSVFLTIIISVPIELKVFEKEIYKEIDLIRTDQMTLINEKVTVQFSDISKLEKKVSDLKNEIKTYEQFRNEKQQEYDFERFGTTSKNSSGNAGIGVNAIKKEAQLNDAEAQLKEIRTANNTEIERINTDLKRLLAQKEKFTNEFNINKNSPGLIDKIDALSSLSDKSWTVSISNFFIKFLFILIELTPILIKFSTGKTKDSYEGVVDYEKSLIRLKSIKSVETAINEFDKVEPIVYVVHNVMVQKVFSKLRERLTKRHYRSA